MTLPSVWFTLLVILSNSLLESVDAQSTTGQTKTSLDVIESLENLSKAITSLQMKMDLQTITLSNLEAKADLQEALLNYLVTTAGTQASLLNNLETKVHVQAKSLSNLEVQSNMQLNSLYKLEANLEMQATALNKFVAKEEWQEPIAKSTINRTIEVLEGDDVEIWCVVHGAPLPEIRWTRETGQLLESDRVVTEDNGKVLRIKNARLSDAGAYVCVAANGVGTPASQFVRLQVYGEYLQCNGLIESDSGNLGIEPSGAYCLSVIKLQNTTGFRMELDPLMTERILVIPEQIPSNASVHSIRLSGAENASHEFEGKSLAIVVPPGRERTTLTWTGLHLNGSGVSSSTKLVEEMGGTLEWESRGDGTESVFWVFNHEFTDELNWTLSTASTEQDKESSYENISFSVLQIKQDGNISEIERICDGSSHGSVKLEASSQLLVLLHIKSGNATRSKLRVSSAIHGKPLKRNVDGIIAGTWGQGAFVIPFSSTQTRVVSSGTIYGLTFDWNSRRINYSQYTIGLTRSSLNGSEPEILVADSSSSMFGMTLEPTTGNLYYGNRSSRTTRVCDNNATKCSTIATGSDLYAVYDVAVHQSKGLLFWSVESQKLVRANLDGSNATVLLERHVWGIDVDEHEDRIYWGSEGGIGSCNLNGQDIRMLPNVNTHTSDVAINNDRVYYANWNSKSIHVISKLGTNSRLVAQLPKQIWHIALFGTRVSNPSANPCRKSKCAHLCVLVNRWSYRCMCPDPQKLNVDGKTCTR